MDNPLKHVVSYLHPVLNTWFFIFRLHMFFEEVKQLPNRYTLLKDKLGTGEEVFKITDDIWERNFDQFRIELRLGVGLVCRPQV